MHVESEWVEKCELRKLCFSEVLGGEMVRIVIKILTKSDGRVVVFWYCFYCWQLAAGKGEAEG
jgi:hypothetical protein